MEESARLYPDFWTCYQLGNTLRDLGRVSQAIDAYERALALKPGFPKVQAELDLLRKGVPPKPG